MGDASTKKSFFKKPTWLEAKAKNAVKSEAKPQEKKDATQMFARSVGTVSDVLAEQKRKEQLRAEKKARAAAQKEADALNIKRRKTSEDGDYEADRDEKKDSISPRRTTRQSSQSSPKSLSKRYEATLESLTKQNDAIGLSEGSDDDPTLSYKPTKPRLDSSKKQTEQEDSQKEDEDEAFPELAAKARERARQEEQNWKPSTSRSMPTGNGGPSISESLVLVDTGPNPTLDILVYSSIEGAEPLLVKRKWNQNFRDIRKAWLTRQPNLSEKVKSEIYFTWRSKKVFDVASCKSLGIKLDQYGNALIPTDQGPYKDTDDRITLCATTDAQIKLEREEEEKEQRRKEKEEEGPEEAPVQPDTSDQIRVILKAKGYPDQKLIVKPDTKVERLEGAFRTHHKIPKGKSVAFVFDGENLEPEMTMEEVDVDDLNMLEVHVK